MEGANFFRVLLAGNPEAAPVAARPRVDSPGEGLEPPRGLGEVIGEFGASGAERECIVAECEIAIRHLTKICGEPPAEMDLGIQWQEHDLGEYPTIVLTWQDAMRGAPGEYIARCEKALTAHENGEEPPTWSRPWFEDDLDEPEEVDS